MASLITLLFLLSISSSLFHHQASSKTHWADVESLKLFKNSIQTSSLIPGSCVSSWDFSVDPCDSLSGERFTCGFACSAAGRVTEITLDQAGYSGNLSSTPWANLAFLQILDLSGNNFSGPIPDSVSKLTLLSRLGMSRNSVSGSIPDSLGSLSLLEELFLDGNELQGPVPATFNGLTSLNRMEIQGNQLDGELPELSRLSRLYYLDASDNLISGGFSAGLPASLVEISMRNNKIQGGLLGQELAGLSYLQVLDLSQNKLSGSVPASLFSHPSLQQLVLSNNEFDSVGIPANLGTESGLIAVDLSGNQLGGFLPEFMGLMPKLSALNLEKNRFTGMIPVQYALKTVISEPGIAPFERLLLGGNYLFGPIPGQFTGLEPGSVDVSLVSNCLMRCPLMYFFCQGGEQRSLIECRSFNPVIPLKG